MCYCFYNVVMKAASDTLTPVTLELGGKDPFIICEDVDVNAIIDVALRSIYINCGQNCVAAERFYVHDKIYDEFLRKIVDAAKKMRQGVPHIPKTADEELSQVLDCGAMNMPPQLPKVEALIKDALDRGAKLEAGGKRNTISEKGCFFEPTVLSNVTHDMRIVNEEAFGPVMLLLRWKSDDEVVKMANASEFGLGSYCFSKNLQRAEGILRQIDAYVNNYYTILKFSGVSIVNDYGVFYIIQELPFGGSKKSGTFRSPDVYLCYNRLW